MARPRQERLTTAVTENEKLVASMGFVRSIVVCTLAGLPMGLGYCLLIFFFQESIRSTDFHSTFYGKYYTPFVLWPFFLASILCGWISHRLAGKVSGLYGIILMIPVAGAAVVAFGVSLGVCRATITPWTGNFWWVTVTLGVGMLLTAAVKIWRFNA